MGMIVQSDAATLIRKVCTTIKQLYSCKCYFSMQHSNVQYPIGTAFEDNQEEIRLSN